MATSPPLLLQKPYEWLPKGQTVAALVPYTKRKQEWIVASVVSWNEEEKTYVVKDEFPENRKLKSWTIPKHKVIRFPREDSELITVGDRVLSLWYLPDRNEWSSMFYEATIVNIGNAEEGRVHLRFNGDDEVYDIDASKLVKKPKRRTKSQKRQLLGKNTATDTFNLPPATADEPSTPEDDRQTTQSLPSPPMKRQRMKLEPEIKPSPLVGRPIISPREEDEAHERNPQRAQ